MTTKCCKIEECIRPVLAREMCSAHYSRWARFGDPYKLLKRQNGSGSVSKNGYVYLFKPDHPNAYKNGKIPEHVFVLSRHLGRPLSDNEYVRHKNNIRNDNRLENLELVQKRDKCSIKNCDGRCQYNNLYCAKHWRRLNTNGSPEKTKRAENGTGSVTSFGYRRIWKPDHPNANTHGTILEHRYVMSQALGRPLYDNEIVHHINGNRLDNRKENLELWVRSHPSGQRVDELVAWAKRILEIYG